jgi:hypothetical protein
MGSELCRQLVEKPSILQDLPNLLPITFGGVSADLPRMQSLTDDLNNGNVATYGFLLEVVDQILGKLHPHPHYALLPHTVTSL